tara:strand:- start:1104 stop:1352 length:249 start_codon:yes stop_codon:yes gene_type:complete
MKILIYPNKKYSMSRVEKLILNMIARKGYNVNIVSSKVGDKIKWTNRIDINEQLDQDLLKNLVVAKCEHYGLKYKIKQKKES